MKSLAFQNFNDQMLTSLGLLIFFTFFVGLLFWVYRKNSKTLYKKLETTPLDDENEVQNVIR